MKTALIFLLAAWGLIASHPLSAAPSQVIFTPSAETVDAFDFIEVALNVTSPDAANSFTDVSVEGEFARAGSPPLKVDGFCDAADGSVFRIRFMPPQPGEYRYSVKYRQGNFERAHSGTFTARDAKRLGQVRIDPAYPEHFIWAGTGEHYFWNGTTTYYLMGWEDDAVIAQAIDRLAALKVNRLRVLVYGRNQDQPWGQPVKTTPQFKLYLNPWPAARPDDVKNPGFDLTRFNVSFWQKYERMLRHARDRGVIVSVIFFIGGQVLPTPFAAYSEGEQRFYRYGVARLAAFANITWDLGNEHNFHREVPKWCDWLGPLVKEWDPYDHLCSAHNVIYRTPGKTWNDMQLIQHWDRGQNAFLLGERAKQAATGRVIPQINEEYGYEDLWEKQPGQRAADTRRRCAWEIAMAGCYQTAGETANRGVGFPPDTGGGWVSGRGDDTMTMLQDYAHLVDFFTSFEWWKGSPSNALVNGGAFCLSEPGQSCALYLPASSVVTLKLADGEYRVRRFNPRTGEWTDLPPASGPVWTAPAIPGPGDWAYLLQRGKDLADTTPPVLLAALAGGLKDQVRVYFSEALDPARASHAQHFTLNPSTQVRSARVLAAEPNVVVLTTEPLTVDTNYTLQAIGLADRAPKPNVMTAPASVSFQVVDASRPLVELHFDEATAETTPNTGLTKSVAPKAFLSKDGPTLSTQVPPGGGSGSLDFGRQSAEVAVDLGRNALEAFKGLKSFTVSGWINCRDATMGPGGNRIVTTINNGGDGFDLVFLKDGRLQLSVNQWPDGLPTKSSAGKIPVDPQAGRDNWRFFAATYDSTSPAGQVKFYFGIPTQDAVLDVAVDYARGPVGHNLGPLTVGHFNSTIRSKNGNRMFRGLVDEIRVFGSTVDGSGALTLEQIIAVQRPPGDRARSSSSSGSGAGCSTPASARECQANPFGDGASLVWLWRNDCRQDVRLRKAQWNGRNRAGPFPGRCGAAAVRSVARFQRAAWPAMLWIL